MFAFAAAALATFTDYQTQGNIAPYAAAFAFGFTLGVVGHIARSDGLVILGILIGGLAAALPWLVWGGG